MLVAITGAEREFLEHMTHEWSGGRAGGLPAGM